MAARASPASSCCALGLRLWGLKQGLPYAYNADENAHFLPRAIGMFGHELDPGYYVNPLGLHVRPAHPAGRPLRRAPGGGGGVRERPDHGVDDGPRGERGAWHGGRRPALPRRQAARRTRGRAARGRTARRGVPAGLLQPPGAQRRPDARAAVPRAVGRGGRPARRAAGWTTLIAGIGIGLAAATKYTGGIVLLALLAAFGVHATRNRGAALRGLAARRRHGARGVLRRVPVRDHRPPRVPRRAEPPVRRLPRGGGQARRHAGQRLDLLPLVVRVGAGLGAARRGRRRAPAAGLPAPLGAPGVPGPGADPLRRLHGLAGALLRALAHARAAVRLPARRDLRRDPRDRGDAPRAGAAPDARRARGDRALRAGARLLRARRAGAVA